MKKREEGKEKVKKETEKRGGTNSSSIKEIKAETC